MDLFENEQQIYDVAQKHINDVNSGELYDFNLFDTLAKEYGKLLKHLRRVTKFSDRTAVDLKEKNKDLIDKVLHDPLTGLFNRRYLEDGLTQNIRALSRSNSMISVMMMDVDFFKKFNDTYGHNAGDDCLRAIAQTLEQCITREDDFLARYGGEEFVFVLPHTDEHGAHVTALRALENIMKRNIPHEKNENARCVTISIGVTTVKVKHTNKGEEYLKCADEALYRSKQNGRNRYTFLDFDK